MRLPHLAELACWCNSRLNDHGRRYPDVQNTATVLWEPYDAAASEPVEVLAAAEADGLDVTRSGASP